MQANLIYIVGPGRSGSTLLDLLLNNHPQIQSLGEFHRLTLFARTNQDPCTCGKRILQCPFWQSVQQAAQKKLKVGPDVPLITTLDPMIRPDAVSSFVNVLQLFSLYLGNLSLHRLSNIMGGRPHSEAVKNFYFWYDTIRQVTGSQIIVDSTKEPRRLKLLYLHAPRRMKIISMVRDGRAVVASWLRRNPHRSMEILAKSWIAARRRTTWMLMSIPKENMMVVKYEALCRNPKGVMQNVCSFLEVPFMQRVLTLRKDISHNISGNPMRFRKSEFKIELDERWQTELKEEELKTFANIAGSWNRKLGYEC